MKRKLLRMVLSAAALSPGVIAVVMHELAISLTIMLWGLVGMAGIATAAIATSTQIERPILPGQPANVAYPSLLSASGLRMLAVQPADTAAARDHFLRLFEPTKRHSAFVSFDDDVAMILSQVMARWDQTEISNLSDPQINELWLIDQLLRAEPAQAGALSVHFAAPHAMLAMRDRVAQRIAAPTGQ